NLWRDRDIIGRELRPASVAQFAEKTVGDGPHWGMWSDRRVWESVHQLLIARISSVQQLWADGDAITDDDAHDYQRQMIVLKLMRVIAPFGMLFGVYVLRWFYRGGGASMPHSAYWSALALSVA